MSIEKDPIYLTYTETKEIKAEFTTLDIYNALHNKIHSKFGMQREAYYDPETDKIRCQFEWSNEELHTTPERIKLILALKTIKNFISQEDI